MQPDDRPVMWSELRRIVDTMSAVQPVEPAEPTGPKESWKPSSENDWLLLFCARCGQRDEVRHARHFVPPPCSAECEPGARMFPKGVLPYITPPSPIDAEALADTVWEALNEWKHSPRREGRRPMTLDRIRELLRGNDVGDLCDGDGRFADIDKLSEYLRLTVPLLRRWTDPTPITPEGLEANGWERHKTPICRLRRDYWSVTAYFRSDCSGVSHLLYKDIDNCKASLPEPRTLGQLNLIVDGIEGVK